MRLWLFWHELNGCCVENHAVVWVWSWPGERKKRTIGRDCSRHDMTTSPRLRRNYEELSCDGKTPKLSRVEPSCVVWWRRATHARSSSQMRLRLSRSLCERRNGQTLFGVTRWFAQFKYLATKSSSPARFSTLDSALQTCSICFHPNFANLVGICRRHMHGAH